jgi:DNA-binding TFAR19-related protein (PDSD5 family)
MIQMSDRELEAVRQRKLQELRKRMAFKEPKNEQVDKIKILNRIFRGRAWEVFNAAQAQFPEVMPKIEHLLVSLTLEGKITEMEGEQLYALLREIGLPVRLNTTIKFSNHGETRSLSEKFKESTR